MTNTLFSCGGMRQGKHHHWDELDKDDAEEFESERKVGNNNINMGSTHNVDRAVDNNSTNNNSKVEATAPKQVRMRKGQKRPTNAVEESGKDDFYDEFDD